jgi:L-ascorbate metabolism protein UlaG (beta-lactamase superfamily)
MAIQINWLSHASFQIKTENSRIYIDPYNIKEGVDAADYIFITHDHFDHCSFVDIEKITKPETVIIGSKHTLQKLKEDNKFYIEIQETKKINDDLEVTAVPSYNIGKSFHPKQNGNTGFVITIGNIRIYHAGDTDLIPEMKQIHCDYALLPIGGTYTMDVEDAVDAANIIDAKTFIPMHYGSIVGDMSLGQKFKSLCKKNVELKEIYDGK